MRSDIAAVDQCVGGQHDGRKERRTQQRAAHLFEHDAQLDVAVARATELFGHDQALQAHLLTHLRPHRSVVAVVGFHLLAHSALGALGVEELAHGLAELVLFFGEGKVHPAMLVDSSYLVEIEMCTLKYT